MEAESPSLEWKHFLSILPYSKGDAASSAASVMLLGWVVSVLVHSPNRRLLQFGSGYLNRDNCDVVKSALVAFLRVKDCPVPTTFCMIPDEAFLTL